QVVDQIDTLTCDLQLEDEMTDSSKTDTLNSSSSSTTASSLEKVKVRGSAPLIKPPAHPSAILTNGGLPAGPGRVPNGDVCCAPGSKLEKAVALRAEKERCAPPGARERVRFSEKVQYHGYCPDCDVRYNIKNREVHLHSEPARAAGKLPHQCPPLPPPPPPLPPFLLENGGLGISPSNSFPPPRPATVPPQTAPKPQKTILRKSTTTTV
ncbi:LARGN protein, partial [Polioptila caerulea]|nr:LARGN protein [Polioptila caerulea]